MKRDARVQVEFTGITEAVLDPAMMGEVLSVIRALAGEGITMMIVTHEMKFARDVSSCIFGAALLDGVPVQSSFPEWKQSDEPASVRECITDII